MAEFNFGTNQGRVLPDPNHEAGRLSQAALAARRLLPVGEGAVPVDRLAALAARLTKADAAQVSLLTDVQTIAGGHCLTPGAIGGQSPLADSLCSVTAAGGTPLIVSNARTDARVASFAPVLSGAVGSYLGVPLAADGGQIVGALCVFSKAARDWSAQDVDVLEELASSTIAELELSALAREYDISRARWQTAIDAAGIGSFDLNLLTGQVSWDDRHAVLLGYEPVAFSASREHFAARVHPEDLARVDQALTSAADSVDVFEVEYRVLLPGGDTRWIQSRGRAVAGADGRAVRLLGAVIETTATHEGEARLSQVLESMSAALMSMDRNWQITYVNSEAERMFAMPRQQLMGAKFWDMFPAAVGTDFEITYRRAVETGEPATLQAFYPAPFNAWYDVRVSPTRDGLSVYFLDITAQHNAEELVHLTTAISNELAGNLDTETAVSALARLVVPRLADWSIVSVVDDDKTLRDLACWHVDPSMRATVETYSASRFLDRAEQGPMQVAVQTAAPVITVDGVTEIALATLKSPTALATVQQLAPKSSAALPLSANGRVVGVLSICRGEQRPPMSDAEVEVALSIAHRAALAMDNARLHAEQIGTALRLAEANRELSQVARQNRTVAVALQKAMHTKLPEPDRLRLAAQYRTAAGDNQVGGDWYDAILHTNGACTLMIGDVVGHDIAAAGLMGQLRNLLRALAWDDPSKAPSEIITRLDHAIRELGLKTSATLTLVQVQPRPQDDDEGATIIRWSAAGHPPMALMDPSGTVSMLDAPTDLMLGVKPDAERRDYSHSVPVGSTLILYTDGLIESRQRAFQDGITQLRGVLERHHSITPEDLLEATIDDMVDGDPEDDIAALAIQFHS